MSTTNNMRGTTRLLLVVIVALLALLGAAPQLAAAKRGEHTRVVPFHAQLVGYNDAGTLCGPALLCFALTGTGQASLLGRVTRVDQLVVDLASQPGPSPDCRASSRTMLLTAATGDQLALLISEVSCPTEATSGITLIAHETWVVTGGAGRFSGATGSGTGTVYVNLPEATAWTVLSGTLSIPLRR